MSTPASNPTHEAPDTGERHAEAPPRARWSHWRELGMCRIWQAVMVSMDHEPSAENHSRMRMFAKTDYDEYARRRGIVLVQYGHHPLLPKLEHEKAGDRPVEKYIRLNDLLAFAKEVGWVNMEAMEFGLARQVVSLSHGRTVEIVHDDVGDDLAKGQRYTLMRMAAILSIFERCLLPGGSVNKDRFLTGERLNHLELGREIERVVAEAADAKRQKTFSNFSATANRKQLGDAKRVFDDYF